MSEQSLGSRIAYIDFLKAFAIATVLLGHSVEQLSGDAFWDHPIWTFLYLFHMPLFMFVSGLFFKSSLQKGFGEVLRVKLVQLGVPRSRRSSVINFRKQMTTPGSSVSLLSVLHPCREEPRQEFFNHAWQSLLARRLRV